MKGWKTMVAFSQKVGLGKRALVVDDEPTIRQIMARVLQQLGFEVDCAPDGLQALDFADQHDYALVVCDLLMPGINGMSLWEDWRRTHPDLTARTLFVTGDSASYETSNFLERSGCPCIFKPFRLNDLADRVLEMQAG